MNCGLRMFGLASWGLFILATSSVLLPFLLGDVDGHSELKVLELDLLVLQRLFDLHQIGLQLLIVLKECLARLREVLRLLVHKLDMFLQVLDPLGQPSVLLPQLLVDFHKLSQLIFVVLDAVLMLFLVGFSAGHDRQIFSEFPTQRLRVNVASVRAAAQLLVFIDLLHQESSRPSMRQGLGSVNGRGLVLRADRGF